MELEPKRDEVTVNITSAIVVGARESLISEALWWAALERLPTYKRVRSGIFTNVVGEWRNEK